MEETPPSVPSDFKVLSIAGLLLAIVLLVLTILFTTLSLHNIDFSKLNIHTQIQSSKGKSASQPTLPPPSAADVATATQVGDQYISYLQQNKPDLAFTLESSNYQQTRSQRPELANPSKYVPGSTPVVVDRATGFTALNDPDVSLVYKFRDDNGAPFYIELWIDNIAGHWYIHGFKSDSQLLQASPSALKVSN